MTSDPRSSEEEDNKNTTKIFPLACLVLVAM